MTRIGIYPGSFDPPTLGHLDVIERAAKIFDRLVIGIGINSSKAPLLTVSQRQEALQQATRHLKNVEIQPFEGLLVGFAEKVGAKSIVRGLRATADFEYEFQMAMVNRRLNTDIECVFLMTKWEYSYLSSSIVKEVAQLSGDISELVPAAVLPYVLEALANRAKQG